MAYEGRRLSTESDKSSTSTNHSTESNRTYNKFSPGPVQAIIPFDQKPSITSVRKTTNSSKRASSMNSPAEQILAKTKDTFVDLNPYFQCSSLPSHWRKNKSLRFIVRTKKQINVKTNTRVTILAGNDYNPCASMKNNVSWFRDGQAEFNDLRFLGASGRGKKFTLTIIIETTPPQQCTYRRAIKITVDGPRKKREIKSKSDANETQADESNMDGDSDNDTTNINSSTMANTASATSISHGSSGLFLLAAVAEQKRKDEEDETNRPTQSDPMEINCSSKLSDKNSPITNCLSPSSSLATQFRTSVAFSPTSPVDDLHSRLPQNSFLTAQSTPIASADPNPPMIKPLPTANLLLSFTSNNDRFGFFNKKSTHDHQTIVESTTNGSSTSTTTTHVLCR